MIKILGKKNDLGGGMLVQRILPDRQKRMVGPFCFLDHMGPIDIAPGQNTDVRPHPHIGLSTLTYLYEGRMVHRDSLASVAVIEPGEVNWMTAGSGISHSERVHPDDRDRPRRLHGLQFWIALPNGAEEVDPSFQHYEQNQIPTQVDPIKKISLIAGEGFGMKSNVKTSSPLIFADIECKKDFEFDIQIPGFELAVYVVAGNAKAGVVDLGANQMLVMNPNVNLCVAASAGSQLIVIGGLPFATPRLIWWNLVSSSKEKIEEAKLKWRSGSFPMVPGETERIPLPEK